VTGDGLDHFQRLAVDDRGGDPAARTGPGRLTGSERLTGPEFRLRLGGFHPLGKARRRIGRCRKGARPTVGAALVLGAVWVALLLLSAFGSVGCGQGTAPQPSEASPLSSRHQSKPFTQARHVHDPLGYSFSYETPAFMAMHEGSHGISADSVGRLIIDETVDQHMSIRIVANSEDDPSCIFMLLVPDPTPESYRSAWRGMTKAEVVDQLPTVARQMKATFSQVDEFDKDTFKVSTGLADGIPQVTLRAVVPTESRGGDLHVWLRYLLTPKRYYLVFWTQDERATYRDTVKLAQMAESVKVTW